MNSDCCAFTRAKMEVYGEQKSKNGRVSWGYIPS